MKNNKKINEIRLNENYLEISYNIGRVGRDGKVVSTGARETPLRLYIELGSKPYQPYQPYQKASFKKSVLFNRFNYCGVIKKC